MNVQENLVQFWKMFRLIQTRRLNLDDDTFTENTRAAYPLTHLPISLKMEKQDIRKIL